MGGGGGDGGAQQREEQRQREQDDATRRVNALFGIYEPGSPQPTPGDFTKDMPADDGQTTTIADVDAYNQALAEWQAQDGGLQQTASGAKTARDALYKDTRQSVFDALMSKVNEQGADATDQVTINLARRGLTGGGADVAAHSRLDRERASAVLDIGNRADSAASNLKTADETARLQLIDRIHGGMSADQAITSANIAQANAAENAKNEALAQSLGQIFSTYAGYNNDRNTQDGYQSGFNRPFGTWNANPTSYYGR